MLRNEKVILSLLSKEMLADVKDYEKTGEDAIFWIANKKGKSYKDIITRLQSSEIEMVTNSGLKTKEEWDQRKNNPPYYVLNDDLVAVDDVEGKGKLYSCYALQNNPNRTTKLTYPLTESYTSRYELFQQDSNCPNYNNMLDRISRTYKIKVKNDSNIRTIDYKPSFKTLANVKSVGYKIFNLCRKYLKKEAISEPLSFSGKINVSTQKLSNAEKLTGILNEIVEKTVNHVDKVNKLDMTKREKYAASLFSDILMSRVIDYGDGKINEKVELALRLQFSNVLAEGCFDVESMDKIADVGMKSALYNLKKLGITLQDAKRNAENAGYEFANEPTTLKDTLLGHKVKQLQIQKEDTTLHNDEKVSEQTKETKSNDKISKKKSVKAKKKSVKKPVSLKDTEEKKLINSAEKPEIKLIPEIAKQPKNKDTQKFETSVRKQIDKIVMKVFDDYMNETIFKREKKEEKSKIYKKYDRRHKFVEQMINFYDINKKVDANGVVENFRTLENNMSKDDVLIAENYANAIINLREAIVESLSEDGKLKDIYKNATSNKAINIYIAEKFKKCKLSTYLNDVLEKSLKDIDKLSEPTIVL